jgi:ferrous iron transport protein B
VIWVLANARVADATMLTHISAFFNPIGRFLGMDGVIIMAFILAMPANEIFLPLVIMVYAASGAIAETDGETLRQILLANGWTWKTAVSVALFSLAHWPCATTLLTIKKETGSLKWTLASFAVPTVAGVALCAAFSAITSV